MKEFLFLLFLVFLPCSVFPQQEKSITILFTNDLHSRLAGYSPESEYSPLSINDDGTRGGFARIAAILKKERNQNPGITLTLDAGDFLMGTLFQSLEPKTGFQLRLMKKMGYDVVATGNHEFDYGPSKLASILRSAGRNGEMPPVLLSNAVFDSKDTADNSLERCFDEGLVRRTTIIEKEGLKFGFFSLMGKVADENAAFAKPLTFAKQAKTAREMVKKLQDEGCSIIICLSHSGVEKNPDGSWGGEDVELAEKVKGIDVIISGHTHTVLDKPVIIKGIPVVQSGEYGKFTGKLKLFYSGGKLNVESYSLIPVDDRIKGDPEVNSLIVDEKNAIEESILKPIGLSYNRPIAEAGFPLECNEQGEFMKSNLAPLVADAIHSYVNRHAAGGTDLSMVAVGVIRDNVAPGIQTAPDIFRIMSMGAGNDIIPGYPLARVYVTGKELKSILEILLVAYKSAPANYCYYSGISVGYDPEGGLLKKIKKIQIIRNGLASETVDFSKKNTKLYSITANSYMLEFVGIIKKMSFGLINVVPKDVAGHPVRDMKAAVIDMDDKSAGIQEGREWLALTEYMRSMKDADNDGIPDIDLKYKESVSAFTVIP